MTDVHEVLHKAVVERIDKLEHQVESINQPESGTLALMTQSTQKKIDKAETELKTHIEKIEAKLNWLLTALLTGCAGTLVTVLLRKLGYK